MANPNQIVIKPGMLKVEFMGANRETAMFQVWYVDTGWHDKLIHVPLQKNLEDYRPHINHALLSHY